MSREPNLSADFLRAQGLIASVSRLKLVANAKDQNDVFGGKPTVFRNISVAAAFFGRPSKQRMIDQELKGLSHAQNLFTSFFGILGGDEVKEPFEVGERPLSYFDRRHARALGRRVLMPDARALK